MPSTSTPFGLRAVRNLDGGPVHTQTFGSRTNARNGIAAANTNVIYIGQTVKLLSTGVIDKAAAGDTNTLGVFAGCEYDDTNGRHIVGNWPGTAGATNIVAWVYTNPSIVYHIQADATMSTANIGENFNLSATGITSGNSGTLQSQQMLGVSTTTNSAAQFQCIGFKDSPDNLATDAFPIVEVKLNLSVESASYSGI